jgi:hypothetical protein
MFVQQEKLRVRPNIAGIRGHKKWQVADQAYAFALRACLEFIRLAEQKEMSETDLIDAVSKLLARNEKAFGRRSTISAGQSR